MKNCLAPICIVLLVSCAEEKPQENSSPPDHVTIELRLPEIVSGIAIDSSLPFVKISAEVLQGTMLRNLHVVRSADTSGGVINIFADSLIPATVVDSVINVHCANKDLRLIGRMNGNEVSIPFHVLKRFQPQQDTMLMGEDEYHVLFIGADSIINDRIQSEKGNVNYFKTFYGNAFNPKDSVGKFPQRKPRMESVQNLMLEGQNWNGFDFKNSADSAGALAAYNEFVNRLEVYDKVGPFSTFRLAIIAVEPLQECTWSYLLRVFSQHHLAQQQLRTEAKKYLADKQANEGDAQLKEFTEDDLLLLYPDRLRWNNRMSGPAEHRYDPFHLMVHGWSKPVAPVILPPKNPQPD